VNVEMNQGIVTSIRGSVIDVRFPAGKVPAIRNVLRTGENGNIRIEVMTQMNTEIVRGISLTRPSPIRTVH
jgi:F-type H+-transporting ATPase subunit beta